MFANQRFRGPLVFILLVFQSSATAFAQVVGVEEFMLPSVDSAGPTACVDDPLMEQLIVDGIRIRRGTLYPSQIAACSERIRITSQVSFVGYVDNSKAFSRFVKKHNLAANGLKSKIYATGPNQLFAVFYKTTSIGIATLRLNESSIEQLVEKLGLQEVEEGKAVYSLCEGNESTNLVYFVRINAAEHTLYFSQDKEIMESSLSDSISPEFANDPEFRQVVDETDARGSIYWSFYSQEEFNRLMGNYLAEKEVEGALSEFFDESAEKAPLFTITRVFLDSEERLTRDIHEYMKSRTAARERKEQILKDRGQIRITGEGSEIKIALKDQQELTVDGTIVKSRFVADEGFMTMIRRLKELRDQQQSAESHK